MQVVDQKTGEVRYSPFSKFQKKVEGFETGSMIIQLYDFAWDDKTRDFKVIEGEQEDRQALIDSYADECGVYNVLKKYAITGDASVLNRKEGFYADISDLPVDELNPAALEKKATVSLDELNKVLGTSYTSEELSNMSAEELKVLISKRVEAISPQKKEEVKPEGEVK